MFDADDTDAQSVQTKRNVNYQREQITFKVNDQTRLDANLHMG